MSQDFELTEADVAALNKLRDEMESEKLILPCDGLDAQIAAITGLDKQPFSTDWSAAMRAAERVSIQWGFILRSTIDGWTVELFDGDPLIFNGVGHVVGFMEYRGRAKDGPLAICRAIVAMQRGESKAAAQAVFGGGQ